VELAPCHDHIYTTNCYRWLDIHGTHRIRGRERVLQLGSRVFPGAPCRWIPGQKFTENPKTSSLAGRVDIGARHTLVNIPWLIAYLLLVTVEGKAIKGRDPASRAKELLQLITSLPSCALEAPCAGGTVVISTRGVSARIDHDGFISAMAGACETANCQSPVPGPLDKATTWILLARLGWRLERMVYKPLQHQVLEVVREWGILLLARLCAGLYEWCVRQVEPSTHSLLATQPQGRGGAGPLLRSRLAFKKNIRGARRTWREKIV